MKLEQFISELVSGFGNLISRLNRRMKFSSKEQLKFLTNLERLLRKLNATKAVRHMANCTSGIHKQICEEIEDSIREGGGVADGIAPWFDPVVVQGIRIGEQRDALHDAVKVSIENQKLSSGNIFSALMGLAYPGLIFIVCGIVAIFLKAQLFPLMEKKLNAMSSLPTEIVVVQSLASFWTFWIYPTTLILMVLIALFISHLNNAVDSGRLDRDSWPLFFEYRQFKVIFFLRMFSMLKKYKITDINALNSISDLQSNPYLGWHLASMIDSIRDGESLGNSLDTGLINKNDVATLIILADGTDVDALCEAIDTTLEGVIDNLKRRISIIVTIAKNILLILIGYLAIQLITFVLSIEKYLGLV